MCSLWTHKQEIYWTRHIKSIANGVSVVGVSIAVGSAICMIIQRHWVDDKREATHNSYRHTYPPHCPYTIAIHPSFYN